MWLGKVSLLERKSKGHGVRGKWNVAGGPRLVLGFRELSKKYCLGDYLRSKKDGSSMRTPEVWNLPVSHDAACGSCNLTGDAEVLVSSLESRNAVCLHCFLSIRVFTGQKLGSALRILSILLETNICCTKTLPAVICSRKNIHMPLQ